ncbi:MAG: amidophosphoribosyltransferase [Atopobium sp.]|nr:amidophosphoribosyltransferase [Atopobium sp.]
MSEFCNLSESAWEDSGEDLHDECGVFGIWAPCRDVSRLTYFALRALQHRGQESAGIAVGDGKTVVVRKDLGLVSQVFSDADLSAMSGKCSIGHVRYGTSGAKSWESAQPHLSTINDTIIALAHNGTLVNSDELRDDLIRLGIPFRSNTDSEVAAQLIGYFTQQTHHLRQGIAHTMQMVEGGYAMTLVRDNALYAFRDPNGIRPLVLGKLPAGPVDGEEPGWVIASETCAFDIIGAHYVRDVMPGEILRISDEGISSEQGLPAAAPANCIFEDVYFSRPDSVKDGRSFYSVRYAMGRRLAQEAPCDVDLIIDVPDSGRPAAEGFAYELGVPYGEGLVKNRYVARTFIQPTQSLRQMGVRLKLNPLTDNIEGKRICMVDDSIVRGTTSKQIVRMLREAGATEVHVRSASPTVVWPCFYGIDTGVQGQLIAAKKSIDEIQAFIEADSLAYLSVGGMLSCVPKNGYCSACFTGRYPVEIPDDFAREKFLEGFVPCNLSHPSEDTRAQIRSFNQAAQVAVHKGDAR